MAVEQVHQGESDGGAQKPVEGVEHGVPVGDDGVVGLHFPQDPGGEDEQQNDDLQHVGQVDLELPLQNGGHEKEHQGQHAEEHVFKISVEKLGYQGQDDQHPEHQVHRGDHALSMQGGIGGVPKIPPRLRPLV